MWHIVCVYVESSDTPPDTIGEEGGRDVEFVIPVEEDPA
jgi:hypothetical protein